VHKQPGKPEIALLLAGLLCLQAYAAAPKSVNSGNHVAFDANAAAATDAQISPAQAAVLFRSVKTILRFDSSDTGLPIRHEVKTRLLSRDQVVATLREKMEEDKDTARIERSAIVLEKFGLLPRHFALRTFLLRLLGEQVAGFYDSKTKTVNLLNWVDADTQKPVLAHELTHALQDQFEDARGVDLDKWENAGPDGRAKTVTEDREHLRFDETDTAREAALEGQAMVAYLDWGLEGRGQTLRTLPQLSLSNMAAASAEDKDSPIMESAPLVLRESLLFPYQEGLIFEQTLLKDKGTRGAFADVLTRPPDTSWEIMHPDAYKRKEKQPLLQMPDLHPILDASWAPYDVGVMGAVDVRMLGEALNDVGAGADAALAWDGGEYYAAQAREASDAQKQDTASIALVYLSRWKTPKAAQAVAAWYRASLAKRYPGLTPELSDVAGQTVAHTSEGAVLVAVQDRYVFISHTLPVPLATTVMQTMLAAQGAGGAASSKIPLHSSQELTQPLRALGARAGVLRAAMRTVY
jgi:hypothetical protein